MPLGTEVGLGPDHVVLDGVPAPPSEWHNSPPTVSAHVCCGQMAGWIKMPLGTEVALSIYNVCDCDTELIGKALYGYWHVTQFLQRAAMLALPALY